MQQRPSGYDQFFKKAKSTGVPAHQAPADSVSIRSKQKKQVKRKPVATPARPSKKAERKVGGLVFILFIASAAMGAGIWKFDELVKFIDHVEIFALGSAQAEESKPPSPRQKQSPPM